jgi:hypothetical protein
MAQQPQPILALAKPMLKVSHTLPVQTFQNSHHSRFTELRGNQMAAGSTYTPIATYTAGSNQTSVTFSSLSGYTDIRIIANMKDSNSYGLIRFNSDLNSNYSRTWVYGTGSSALSSRTTNATEAYFGATPSGSDYYINDLNLMNYSNTTTNKTMLIRQSGAADQAGAYVYLYRSTSAITSISFISATGSATIAAGSTITLYGIAAA